MKSKSQPKHYHRLHSFYEDDKRKDEEGQIANHVQLYRLRQTDVKAGHFERKVQALEAERDQWETKYEEMSKKYQGLQKEFEDLQNEMANI